MCRYVQKMTKLKSQITLKSQISKTLFLQELEDLANFVFGQEFYIMCPSIFRFTIPPSGFPRVGHKNKSDVLTVGQKSFGDVLTLGQ